VATISFLVPFIFIIDVMVSARTAGKLRPKEYDLRAVLTREAEQELCFTCYRSERLSTASISNAKSSLSGFIS
jgi:hypothetical protein